MKHTTYLRSDFEVISYETRKGKALNTRCEKLGRRHASSGI